ncbi:MAG: hypothetical protein KJ072_04135 [Verrucomicrobia bacterium]|nr:hypothetical protein [Verrucomicrobiota bacterium]
MKVEALEKSVASARKQALNLKCKADMLAQVAVGTKDQARLAKRKLKVAKRQARQARKVAKDAKRASADASRAFEKASAEVARLEAQLEKARKTASKERKGSGQPQQPAARKGASKKPSAPATKAKAVKAAGKQLSSKPKHQPKPARPAVAPPVNGASPVARVIATPSPVAGRQDTSLRGTPGVTAPSATNE